ncbi:MAG: T9SS type A sorting domain-containing protein [Bacteroidales bacterium]|nr:T9SS type A sorting domain-containing protein [Bacteroidales bacterium]
MKKIYKFLRLRKINLFFLCSAFLLSGNLFGQLNGTYTIGTIGTEDYTSFTEAVTALTTNGINGNVVFNVSTGDYNEQISIPEITGASKTDTIIFQSASGDTADVKIYYEPAGSGDNYTINFDGVDFITFQNLTIASEGASDFGTVITINNNIEQVHFIGNHFIGKTGTVATHTDKTIVRGDMGSIDKLVIFNDNKFDNCGEAMRYENTDSLIFCYNTIINDDSNKGLYFFSLKNSLVEKNAITGILNLYYFYGNTPVIVRNNIVKGYISVYEAGFTSDNYPLQVYNNFVRGGIIVRNSKYANIYNNTVYNNSYYPIWVYSTSSEIEILNNIFYADNAAYPAILIEDIASIDTLDFNNLYATGAKLVTSNSIDYATLADWQAAVNQSANSYNVDINFVDEANVDFHIADGEPDLFGTTFTGISDDIDGESRHATEPNIGADEYSTHPLSGTYTIGKNGTEDYESFSEAVESLVFNGISGSTSFNVSAGTYEEQISIPEITGASETDTIIFQSASGDNADVKIYHEPAGSGDNYTINFDGVDYITFQNLTIASEGASDFGTVITINNNIKQVCFVGNHLIGKTGATATYTDKTIIRGDLGSVDTFIVFNDNKFDNCKAAIRYEYTDSLIICNNTIINDDANHGLYIAYLNNSLVESNTITGGQISLKYISGNTPVIVRNNIIQGWIQLYEVGSSSDNYPVRVYNNFVRGIFVVRSNYVEIFNNTVYSNSFYPIRITDNANEIKFLNNIVYADNPSYPALYIEDIASIDTLDFNNLYSTGSTLVTSNSVDYATLAEWQAAVNQSANSYNVDLTFVDEANTDLHIADGNPALYGTTFTGIIYDIDGELRHETNPNIGADEYVFLNDQNDFLTYSFTEQTGDAIINTDNHTISVEVAYGTDLTSLVATFTISENATVAIGLDEQVSGVTENDFSSPVTYVITAEDASEQNWLITVSKALNDENDITLFTFPERTGPAVINNVAHTVDIEVEYNTDITSLVASFALSENATAFVGAIEQQSGITTNDFSSPVTYTITAEDASEQNWIVTVTEALNDENDILTFSFTEQTGAAVINNVAHTVDIEVEFGTDITSLVAAFTLSAEATAKIGLTDQVSGTTANDFSSPVTYVIIAEDASEQNWIVTVTEALNDENDFLTFSFAEQAGAAVINDVVHTVNIEVVFGTDVTALVATFTLSPEATAKIGTTDQVSGTTPNDFTSDVTYTIQAEDGTTQDWIVTVIMDENTENDILTFSFPEQNDPAVINVTDHTVQIELVPGSSLYGLTATFTLSENANAYVSGVEQASGTTANDFDTDVVYTIIAHDDTEQDWIVTVSVEPYHGNDFLSFSFYEQTGDAVIDSDNHMIDVEVNESTNIASLVASFTISDGATINIDGTPQTSGVTENNFSTTVSYDITAQDGNSEVWVVNVTVEDNSTGIEDMEELEFVLYPNPATDYINIKCSSIKNELIVLEIFDITGKVISSKQIFLNNDLNITFNFNEEVPTGIYLLNISTENKSYTKRFIIK